MFTCSKTYSDIPFAHRQHKHNGNCSFIHGHNWSFKFTFTCEELDEKGFVVDFGDLKFIRQWLNDNLDHAYVYNANDSKTTQLLQEYPELFKGYAVESCSAEGLAKHVYESVLPILHEHHGERVKLISVEVMEDSKNAARYCP
jgi:6-pyruvoyltetrahydropterin/6-carboxytetrahydropterin synthase